MAGRFGPSRAASSHMDASLADRRKLSVLLGKRCFSSPRTALADMFASSPVPKTTGSHPWRAARKARNEGVRFLRSKEAPEPLNGLDAIEIADAISADSAEDSRVKRSCKIAAAQVSLSRDEIPNWGSSQNLRRSKTET